MGKITIGIDASRYNSSKATGVENYSNEIINRLIKNRVYNFILWSPHAKPASIAGPNVEWKTLPAKKYWSQTVFAKELFQSKNKVDVVFIPSHVLPYLTPKSLPIVTTIHDLSFLKYENINSPFQQKYLKYGLKQAGRAKSIIVPSKSVKEDMLEYSNIPAEKINVIYHGIDIDKYKTKTKSTDFPKNIHRPYILYTGRITAKKNLIALIEAYILLKNDERFKHQLILVGKTQEDSQEIFDFINDLTIDIQENIIYAGYLNANNYIQAIQESDIYVLPSLDEGFGLTVLEAMAAGIPTVVSNISTLTEITKEASLYADPNKPFEFASAISKIIRNPEIRQDLIKKGQQLIKGYSWQESADKTLAVLTQAIKK